MSILEDLEDLEMAHAGDAEAPTTGDQPPPPKTIFDLLNARRWDEARGWIDYRPECVYDQNEAQHRTPLHVICCMKFDDDGDNDDNDYDVQAHDSGDDEQADNDDDNRKKNSNADLEGAMSVARLILECSHGRTDPAVCLHPVPEWHPEHEYAKGLHNSVLTVQDVYGDTALHCLCGNLHGGSSKLTKLVLEHTADYGVDPWANRKRRDGKMLPTVNALLSQQNFHGCTPMHFCADGGCTQGIVDLILGACQDYCPKVHGKSEAQRKHPICIQDEDGDTPIHFACSAGLAPDVLRRFVMQPHPTVVYYSLTTKAHNGRTPIDDLICWGIDEYGIEANTADPPLEERMPVADALWSRVEVLIQGVVFGFYRDYQETTPFHWAAGIHIFPAVVLRLACKRCVIQNSEGLLALDKKGMTLLHHAVKPICLSGPDSSVYDLGSGEYLELSRWRGEGEQRTPIEYLLELCPAALRIRSKDGALPIHSALLSGIPAIEDILAMLDAAPETLAQRDGQGLLPFMVAASKGCSDLDNAFKLLLLNPELVRNTSEE